MTRFGSTNILGPHIPIAVCTALGIVTLLVASSADAENGETRPPNVVVILVDDLGWADIGPPSTPISVFRVDRPRVRRQQMVNPFHESDLGVARRDDSEFVGFQTTPHIERLFEQGIVLDQYLTHTLCSPSRAGLLTGRHYTRVGSGPQTNGTLRLDISNVARDLQSSGYATAAFGKWHNGYPNFPADGNGALVAGRDNTDPENDLFENYKHILWGPGVNAYGFDVWQGFYGGATDYFNRTSWWDNDTSWWTDQRYTPGIIGHTVDIVADAAVEFIVGHSDEPFFCFVSMPAPHNPIQVLRSDLDGRDGFAALLERAPTHPPEESTFISFNQEWAVARGGRWKLLYNETGSKQEVELYDIQKNPLERVNIGASQPEIRERLIEDLQRFMTEGHLAMSYFPPRAAWISAAEPSPDGNILEVRASQTGTIDNGDTCGLFVKFATAGIKDYATEQLESGDLLSFDLYVASDSDHASGFFVTPGRGYTPIFDNASGVAADGNLMVDQVWPKQLWRRVTVGIGELAPLPQAVDYIALRSPGSGTYHFFLDNVAILRHDGSTKAVIWASKDDTLRLRYRYCGTKYNEWESLADVPGFPFSNVSVQAVD